MITTQGLDNLFLRLLFDAFSYDFQAQTMRHGDHGFAELFIIIIGLNIASKSTINLDPVNRQFAQIIK